MAESWSSAATHGTSSARADGVTGAPQPLPGRVRATPGGGRGGGGGRNLRDEKEHCPQMARLVGVDLPRDKRLEVALTYVYGVGRTRALETLKATGVSGDIRVNNLADDDLVKLRDWIDANY